MKKHDDFDMDDLDLDLGLDDTQSKPKEKPFSFNDLDLGLDFDLSFLDDIEDPEETKEPPKPAAPQEPVKRPAPVQAAPAAPAAQNVRRPAAPASSRPAAPQNPPRPSGTPSGQRPANAGGQRPGGGMPPHPANAQRGVNGQRPAGAAGARPANGQRPMGSPNGQRPANGVSGQRPAGTPGQRPAAKRPMPAQESSVAKKKSGPRLGGVIFYTLYFLFILVFFLGTFIGLNWLHGWLTDYELAQPGPKAEQVFTQLFTNPDWGALYDSAGAKDSAYEGKDAYVTYMQNKVGDQKLTYLETSAGLSGDKKYVVRLGSEKVAAFTLTDKNKASGTDKLENLQKIPDWQLSTVEVYFDRQDTYYVVKLDGHTAMVNDVPLGDDTIIQVATTKAEDYLPEGTTGASMCTQQVDGLMAKPVVTIFDKDGKQMEVTYDEATRTFTERLESNTMTDDQREAAVKAAETYCNWMLAVDNDRGHAAQIFDPTGEAYKTLTSLSKSDLWVQSNNGFTFDNMKVTDFALYSGDIFSVRVTIDVNVTRTDGTTKDFGYDSTLFFRKQDTGKWLVYDATNADVNAPVGKVRLTFMNGDTVLSSDFVKTDATELDTPLVSAPEGKVFIGWYRIDKYDNGTTYTMVFDPDENGHVTIPSGTTLEPMTLYALFETPSGTDATEGG